MEEKEILFNLNCDMTVTLAIAALLLLLGHGIKRCVPLLRRFFIPAPVVGGLFFAFITLAGYNFGLFTFTFDSTLKNLLMNTFFTSVGFLASLRFLVKGGMAVGIFLAGALGLIVVQNVTGVVLAELFGLNPLIGLATGSISLSGGHGTAAAFGPLLEDYGLEAGLSVSVAAATFGLVAGSMIGGPIGRILMARHSLHCPNNAEALVTEGRNEEEKLEHSFGEKALFAACVFLIMAQGIGYFLNMGFQKLGIIFPSYLCPMFVACLIRNYCDFFHKPIPMHTIGIVGSLSLQFFLAMALMTLKLWELASLAVPLVTILLLQTVIMGIYVYFITFRIMGSDYDAAVMTCGHCGFGMGATPNAMANMETFTGANGPSAKAFFVVPLVGSLFIDFFNAFIITSFIQLLI